MSEDEHDSGHPRNTDTYIGQIGVAPMSPSTESEGNQSLTICNSDVSPDNSYQPLIAGPVGANVSEDGHDTGHTRKTDTYIGQTGFAPMNPSTDSEGNQSLTICNSDVSPDNSYQSLIAGPVGANVSEDGHDTGHTRKTDTYIGQTGFAPMNPSVESEGNQSLTICNSDVSPDNSYQPLIAGPAGANVSEDGHDTGHLRNTDTYIGQIGFAPMNPSTESEGNQSLTICNSDVSPDNSYQPLITGPAGANVSEDRHDTGHPRNTDTYIGQIGFAPMNHSAESEGNQSLTIGKSDVSPDNSYQPLITGPMGANVLEDGQDTCLTRNMDPLIGQIGFTPIKPSDVVYMNNDFNGLSNLDENSPSSDSGIHSYDEHWAALSTESGNSDSIQTSESTRSIDISPVKKRIVPDRQLDPQFHRGVVNSLQANLVRHGSVSDLSTDGYNSDVAAMADFSDEDIEPWEDEETCVAEQPSLPTESDDDVTINIELGSYDYAILHKIPPMAVLHDPDDEFNMDYWINFRALMNKDAIDRK